MVKEGNLENQEEKGTTEQKYESKQLTIIFLTSYINHLIIEIKIIITLNILNNDI